VIIDKLFRIFRLLFSGQEKPRQVGIFPVMDRGGLPAAGGPDDE